MKDKSGKTALYLAALEGWVTITQLLLKSGANILLLINNNSIIMFFLITFLNVNEFNDENWAPLHAAIMRNQIDCFMTLLSCGAWDVNLGKQNPFELAMDNLLLEASQLLVYPTINNKKITTIIIIIMDFEREKDIITHHL